MLLDLNDLYSKYKVNTTGIIHIGAHIGEEYISYLEHQVPQIVFFEPIPQSHAKLCNHIARVNSVNPNLSLPDIATYNCALGNKETTINLNVSKHSFIQRANGASSSILKPKKHLELHDDVVFEEVIEVDMHKLDNVNGLTNSCNFINIDVQGYELEVFKGGINTLQHIDYIISEVNTDEVYEGCVLIDELDAFLKSFRFYRAETCMGGGMWGDAFYVKR